MPTLNPVAGEIQMFEFPLTDAEVVVVERRSLEIIVGERQLGQLRQFEARYPRGQKRNTILMQIDPGIYRQEGRNRKTFVKH